MRGNPGRRPLPKGEPQPERGRPSCPAWLDKEAKAEWRRVVPRLDAMGVLAETDRSGLSAYCVVWSRWRDAEDKVTRFGMVLKPTASGYLPQNPYVSLARHYLEQVRRYQQEFGLTPASRTRLQVLPGGLAEDDPLAKYLYPARADR